MADFKTHISTSSVLGFAYAGVGHVLFHAPLSSSILAGGLCAVSGMLPDIDSDSGIPKRESLTFAAAVVPMMLIGHMQRAGCDSETIVLVGATIYLAIRFLGGHLLSRFTVHRGMFHSIPAAACFGQAAFLLASGPLSIRLFKASAVLMGYLSHLLLDEFYSIDTSRGRVRLRKSFGTGLKMFSKNIFATAVAYLTCIFLALTIVQEPRLMAHLDALGNAAGTKIDASLERLEQHRDKTTSAPSETDAPALPQIDDTDVVPIRLPR
ncbi:MAG: metal-dependent hydrolase [Planctomycetota bacterium]|nr:MAG: metal-dependent hydrolase [Planctomycetota bacterium]